MRDDDGMGGLPDKALALETACLIGILVIAASAKGGGVGMNGAHAFERLLQTIGKCVIGGIHIGEERVAALFRQFAGKQDRAHRGLLIVGMIRMPTTTDVGLLRLLLTHFGDFGILLVGREEFVDVDIAPATRKGDMLLRGQSSDREKR